MKHLFIVNPTAGGKDKTEEAAARPLSPGRRGGIPFHSGTSPPPGTVSVHIRQSGGEAVHDRAGVRWRLRERRNLAHRSPQPALWRCGSVGHGGLSRTRLVPDLQPPEGHRPTRHVARHPPALPALPGMEGESGQMAFKVYSLKCIV